MNKYKPEPNFSLAEFAKLNIERCDDPEAFNCGDKTNLYFSTALAEEVGEICGVIKKLDRGFNEREHLKMAKKWANKNGFAFGTAGFSQEDLIRDYGMPDRDQFEKKWLVEKLMALAEEAADLYIYLDLLAQKNRFSLWDAVGDKFNSVSNDMKVAEKYTLYPNQSNQ